MEIVREQGAGGSWVTVRVSVAVDTARVQFPTSHQSDTTHLSPWARGGALFICLFCTPFVDFPRAKGEPLERWKNEGKLGRYTGYQWRTASSFASSSFFSPPPPHFLDMPAMRNNAAQNVNEIRICLMPIAMLMCCFMLFYAAYPCCLWHPRGHRTINMHDLTFTQKKTSKMP